MTLLVIDASVAVKWFIPEIFSDIAEGLLLREYDFIAPDFMLLEVSNILWKKYSRKEVAKEETHFIFKKIQSGFVDFMPTFSLVERAYEIGIALKHPTYDCLYLALSEKEDGCVVTADAKFVACCKGSEWEKRITFLGDHIHE